MDENIIRLAELQDSGELSPAAEESLALAYAERHAHELRYVAAWGRWMRYDGTVWVFDDTLHAFDRARAICREVALECDKAKLATAIASAKTVAAVERLAKADRRLAAAADQWDVDPWLLQDDCATIDLRTGVARESAAINYITRKAACTTATRRASPNLERLPTARRPRPRVTKISATILRILGHGPHERTQVRLCLRHRRQRQVDLR
jgi:putative DNA primase/helicase